MQACRKELTRLEEVAQAQEAKPPRPPVICGYIRCSHEDSKDSGLGEDAQRKMAVRCAGVLRDEKPHLSEDIRWFDEEDPVSAYKVPFRQRPGGKKLLQFVQRGDHVIFAYLDRAFRNTEDCLSVLRYFKDRGVIAHFANVKIDMDTAIGELTVTIMAACAKMESAMKSERIKEVFAGFVGKGRVANGHAPIGFKLFGPKGIRRTVVPDLKERRVMGEIVRVRDAHGWTWAKISEYVEEWAAKQEGRKPKPVWEKRQWPKGRCRRAYEAELELRNGRNTPAVD